LQNTSISNCLHFCNNKSKDIGQTKTSCNIWDFLALK